MEKKDGKAFVGYCNDTPHYLFRKHKLNKKWHFDIENEGLIYSDCTDVGTHGLQCNYRGNEENYQKIMDLCQKVVELVKEIDELNTIK